MQLVLGDSHLTIKRGYEEESLLHHLLRWFSTSVFFVLKHLSSLVLLTLETSAEGATEAAGEDRGEAEGAAGDGAQVQRGEGEGGARDLQVYMACLLLRSRVQVLFHETLASLASAQFALVRLCLHWLGI